MVTTFAEARDEINAMFYEAWEANTPTIVGYMPEIRWQGVDNRDIPDGSKFWCHVRKETVIERQSTFRLEGQRYTTKGVVLIELFCPKSNAEGYKLGSRLAMVARDAFRGKQSEGGIWFRNVTIGEVVPDTEYYRLNVTAEYEYDEIISQ